jgi:hypothetical protein
MSLFSSGPKSTAPGINLPTGWTQANVPTAADLNAIDSAITGLAAYVTTKNAANFGTGNTGIQAAITAIGSAAGVVVVPATQSGTDYSGVTITRNDILILDYRNLPNGAGGAHITIAGKNNADNTVHIYAQLAADGDGNPNFGWFVGHEIAALTNIDLILRSGGGGADIRLKVANAGVNGTVHFDTPRMNIREQDAADSPMVMASGRDNNEIAAIPNDLTSGTWPSAGFRLTAQVTGGNSANKDLIFRNNNPASSLKVLDSANAVEILKIDDSRVTFGAANVYKGFAAITAFAGGGQANATQLSGEVSFVATVASAGDSVKLPVAALGKRFLVFNQGANSTNIYPTTGGQIDALGANNPYALAAGGVREFWGKNATDWVSKS